MFPEARITFSGVSTVPDLILYRRERVPRDLRDVLPGVTLSVDDFFAPLAADWG